MTIKVESGEFITFNYSTTPVTGYGYSCGRKLTQTYTLVRKMVRGANGSAVIGDGTPLREGQVKKLLRKHRLKAGYTPKVRAGFYNFYL